MDGYQERVSSIDVPSNTGVEGFLKTLKKILGLPRVQSIHVEANGKVEYRRFVRKDEPDAPINVDYSGLEPWNVIRNGAMQEVTYVPGTPAASVIASLFNVLTQESLVPIAFATGAGSFFWDWHEQSGVLLARKDAAYGLPIYTDRQMPDYALVLCAAYVRSGLTDCHRFLMVGMPTDEFIPPETNVSVL